MASVSTLAMWLSKNSGNIDIVWLGWEINTSVSIFLLIIFVFFFIFLILFLLLRNLILFPIKIKNNIKKYNIRKAEYALEEGLLASAYNEKKKIFKSYHKTRKYLKETPLHLLLKLQNYLIKGNEVQCFNTYKKMLDFSASRPLAIKGLILIANKNGDSELFSNMLVSAKSFKMPIDTFIFESLKFCIQNGGWELLKEHTIQSSKKHSVKTRNAISFVNFNLAKENLEKGNQENTKKILEKIFAEKIYFPNYMELYCNLNMKNKDNRLKKILKAYWKNFPHENILECVLKNFKNLNMSEKVKLLINLLEGHNNLYLKYLLLGEIKSMAKIWGDSKKDLLKSIELFPNKKAYLLLVNIEEQTSCNKNKIKNWLALAEDCRDKLWQCNLCSSMQKRLEYKL